MTAVEHDVAGRRFVARVDGGEAELVYQEPGGKVLDLVHTFVPEEARGGGVAEALVERAFAWARENGYRVRPSCPYVKGWLGSHPEEQDLVDQPR